MALVMRVMARMLRGRGVTAADAPTAGAAPQVEPPTPAGQAFDTAVTAGRDARIDGLEGWLAHWVQDRLAGMPRAMGTATTVVDRLLDHLLPGRDDPSLVAELESWLTGSPRFRTFADAHRDKIRKKLRTAGDPESMRDVRAELRVAQLLLADRRIELAFEAHGSGRGGPDFTVSYRQARAFDLEVTRHRGDPAGTSHAGPLLVKLRQLPPSVANVLVIGVDGDRAGALDLLGGIRRLRAVADAKDENFFQRRGFEGTRDFYHRFLRLGAVLVWCEGGGETQDRVQVWENGSARIPAPAPALSACVTALQGG